MEFRVGKATAACEGCGATQFKPCSAEDPHGSRNSFACVACGTPTSYAALMRQIDRQRNRRRPVEAATVPGPAQAEAPWVPGLLRSSSAR